MTYFSSPVLNGTVQVNVPALVSVIGGENIWANCCWLAAQLPSSVCDRVSRLESRCVVPVTSHSRNVLLSAWVAGK